MGIGAIFSLIMGIVFIIYGILLVNHYMRKPEEEGALITTSFSFILGIIGIIGAITGYVGLVGLILLIICVMSSIYLKKKHPELKKHQEKYHEIYGNDLFSTIAGILGKIAVFCFALLFLVILVIVFFKLT